MLIWFVWLWSICLYKIALARNFINEQEGFPSSVSNYNSGIKGQFAYSPNSNDLKLYQQPSNPLNSITFQQKPWAGNYVDKKKNWPPSFNFKRLNLSPVLSQNRDYKRPSDFNYGSAVRSHDSFWALTNKSLNQSPSFKIPVNYSYPELIPVHRKMSPQLSNRYESHKILDKSGDELTLSKQKKDLYNIEMNEGTGAHPLYQKFNFVDENHLILSIDNSSILDDEGGQEDDMSRNDDQRFDYSQMTELKDMHCPELDQYVIGKQPKSWENIINGNKYLPESGKRLLQNIPEQVVKSDYSEADVIKKSSNQKFNVVVSPSKVSVKSVDGSTVIVKCSNKENNLDLNSESEKNNVKSRSVFFDDMKKGALTKERLKIQPSRRIGTKKIVNEPSDIQYIRVYRRVIKKCQHPMLRNTGFSSFDLMEGKRKRSSDEESRWEHTIDLDEMNKINQDIHSNLLYITDKQLRKITGQKTEKIPVFSKLNPATNGYWAAHGTTKITGDDRNKFNDHFLHTKPTSVISYEFKPKDGKNEVEFPKPNITKPKIIGWEVQIRSNPEMQNDSITTHYDREAEDFPSKSVTKVTHVTHSRPSPSAARNMKVNPTCDRRGEASYLKSVVEQIKSVIDSDGMSASIGQLLIKEPNNIFFTPPWTIQVHNLTTPRLHHRMSKPLIQDNAEGPKEVTLQAVHEVIARPPSDNEVGEFYAFPSTTIEIPCTNNEDLQLSPLSSDSVQYHWTHGNQHGITEGRLKENANLKGSLEIRDVTLTDSDLYVCYVSYVDPEINEVINETFHHLLKVVQLPQLVLRTLARYTLPEKCSQDSILLFELYVTKEIERVVCQDGLKKKLCSIDMHNPLCYKLSLDEPYFHKQDPKLYYEYSNLLVRRSESSSLPLEKKGGVLSLNYQLKLNKFSGSETMIENFAEKCPPHCQQKIQFSLISKLKNSFEETLRVPVISGNNITYNPDKSAIHVHIVIGCDGGLELFNGFCVPCKAGEYSKEGDTKCSTCPPGTTQDLIAAKSCRSCNDPFENGCFLAYFTSNYLGLIVLSSVIVSVVVSGCYSWYYYYQRQMSKENYLNLKSNCGLEGPESVNLIDVCSRYHEQHTEKSMEEKDLSVERKKIKDTSIQSSRDPRLKSKDFNDTSSRKLVVLQSHASSESEYSDECSSKQPFKGSWLTLGVRTKPNRSYAVKKKSANQESQVRSSTRQTSPSLPPMDFRRNQ